jgi:hypothetical protein
MYEGLPNLEEIKGDLIKATPENLNKNYIIITVDGYIGDYSVGNCLGEYHYSAKLFQYLVNLYLKKGYNICGGLHVNICNKRIIFQQAIIKKRFIKK